MTTIPTNKIQIPDRLFFRIGDVADLLGVKPHVLRYWESEFPGLAPQKSATGQRIYRRSDVETLLVIKRLLHEERYSIEGARKRIKELRKEGSLKTYLGDAQEEAVSQELVAESRPALTSQAARDAASVVTREKLLPLRALAVELRKAARRPISELFG
jgi:DNA-binding transcriptional MerR regulator